jgi:hypothetical protein
VAPDLAPWRARRDGPSGAARPVRGAPVRAIEVPLGDLVVPIAAREDLITMKRAAGRPQDLADVELLEGLDGDLR